MKKLSCRDCGFDCDYMIKGDTREAIFEFGKNHVIIKHGPKKEDFTPRLNEKLKLLMKEN